MGRQRPNEYPQQQQPQPQSAEIAAAVAALLLAGSPTVPAMAAALLPMMPLWLLRLPELAADVAEEAARVTLEAVMNLIRNGLVHTQTRG